MKRIGYLLFTVIIVTALSSCSKELSEDNINGNLKKQVITEITESSPVSSMDIVPYLIPGANNGGNRSCAEVAEAFNTGFALCGDKIDYENGNFSSNFPNGLNVTTDGMYVSFYIDGCLEINGETYKVGAAIVKGSDQANIYFYPDGATSDSKLASPINSSGNPAGLSNLTFCFVPCEVEQSEWVIALKTTMTMPGVVDWAYCVSGGTVLPNDASETGYNYYIPGTENTYELIYGYGPYDQKGTITAKDYYENSIRYLEIAIETFDPNWVILETFLYVGSVEGYKNTIITYDGSTYIDIDKFPFYDNTSNPRIIKIPFSDIVK